jgi:SPP1 gp7 family putative phage head morphogenesis protein
MPDIYAIAEEFKRRLLARERRAASELVRAYALAVGRIEERIHELTTQIAAARRSGENISSGFLYERNRLTNLRLAIRAEMGRFSQVASLRVIAEQRAASALGRADAQALVGEVTGAPVAVRLGALDPAAVANAVGFASDGSPLQSLFGESGARVAERVTGELVAGVVEGVHPRVIAARVRKVFGGDLSRALTIARTETLRTYRETVRETYLANSGSLSGWYWQAALDVRTCAMCLSMHGRVFPVGVRLVSHPCCRCVQVPLVRDAELPETGAEWLARQESGLQKSALGPGKYRAFKEGKMKLSDLEGIRTSPRWGVTRFEKPLSAIIKESE